MYSAELCETFSLGLAVLNDAGSTPQRRLRVISRYHLLPHHRVRHSHVGDAAMQAVGEGQDRRLD